MNFQFLISTTFVILSIALLMDERKEMSLKNLVESIGEIPFDDISEHTTNHSYRLLFAKKKSFSEYRYHLLEQGTDFSK